MEIIRWGGCQHSERADGLGFKRPVGSVVCLLTFIHQKRQGRKSSFAVLCQSHQDDTETSQQINSRRLMMTRVPGRARSPDADLSSRFARETAWGLKNSTRQRVCFVQRWTKSSALGLSGGFSSVSKHKDQGLMTFCLKIYVMVYCHGEIFGINCAMWKSSL